MQTNGDNPVVKLADFGLSKFVDDGTVLKTECGTALYVAPEVILKNFKTYTDKVDVWSLGVILFVWYVIYSYAIDGINIHYYMYKKSKIVYLSACQDLCHSQIIIHLWLIKFVRENIPLSNVFGLQLVNNAKT